MIDCIYIAASARDARYTRICVASIRYFYPEIPIQLLAGGPLQRGLAEELHRYWDVEVANLPLGDYGWGFVKLEPLFRPPGERFMILDSDTVFTGPVLKVAVGRGEDFIVDDEHQTPARAKEIYYNWEGAEDEGCSMRTPSFFFNTGQWFGRSGILRRDDFADLIQWSFPRRLTKPSVFKNGEQGVLNFVINEQVRIRSMQVLRVPLMRWPGYGLHGLDVENVSKRSARPMVVHWAGMKRTRLSKMTGASLLAYFEQVYYQRLPAGSLRRALASSRSVLSDWQRNVLVRFKLSSRRFLASAATLFPTL